MEYLIITKSGQQYTIVSVKYGLREFIDEVDKITDNGFLTFEDIAIMKSDISAIKLIK